MSRFVSHPSEGPASSELPVLAGQPGAGFAAFGLDEAAPAQSKINWQRYLSAMLRHKWLVLLVTLLGTAGGAVATRFVTLQYQAQSTIWVEVSRGEDSRGPLRDGELLQSHAWIELLRSYKVLDHVVQEQRLYISAPKPEDLKALDRFQLASSFRPGAYKLTVSADGKSYVLAAGEGAEVERGPVGGPVGKKAGFEWTPSPAELRAGRVLEFSVTNPRDVAKQLGQQLGTQMAENGNFLMVSLQGPDPERITSTLNAVAKRYESVAALLKRQKLDELTSILHEQLRYAEKGLHDAESAYEGFRVNTVTLPTEQGTPVTPGLQLTQDPVYTNYFDMKIKQDGVKQEREAIDRVLAGAAGGELSLDGLASVPSARNSAELMAALDQRNVKRAELRVLQQKYTDEMPRVRALITELATLEGRVIPELAGSLRAQLASQEMEMNGRIASASSELREIPPRAIEEARLKRQVAIANDLHTTLKQRYEVARLAAAGTVPDLRVLDKAVVPSAPVSDPRMSMLALALVGSLGLSVLIVVLLDRVDPRVRYPEQVSGEMGLPMFGAVPHVAANAGEEEAALVSEAFREIRLNVTAAHGSAGPVMLTISSAQAGDGKSFTASNLALSFAHQGHRTILIDGDIRRGRLHHLLGCTRTPGLTDYLRGQATFEEILQETSVPSVFFIGSGTRLQAGPELLGSPLMGELLAELKRRYDAIIMDSPPLGAGVDPYVLSTVTGNLLLVFRTGNTNRAFANTKLALFDRLPVRILGAVMNAVPSDQRAYRYYSYLPGYHASDEDEAVGATALAARP